MSSQGIIFLLLFFFTHTYINKSGDKWQNRGDMQCLFLLRTWENQSIYWKKKVETTSVSRPSIFAPQCTRTARVNSSICYGVVVLVLGNTVVFFNGTVKMLFPFHFVEKLNSVDRFWLLTVRPGKHEIGGPAFIYTHFNYKMNDLSRLDGNQLE